MQHPPLLICYQLHCYKCDEFTPGHAYEWRVYCGNCKCSLGQIQQVILPFGKHKGRLVHTLTKADELRYLDWFVLNITPINEPLRLAILAQLGYLPDQPQPPMPWWAVLLELRHPIQPADVKSAYRTLAKRYHPDAGGSEEQMQLLNEARTQANFYLDF